MARPRRPVRNIAARSWFADVRRFHRLINTDEVLGTHRCRSFGTAVAWNRDERPKNIIRLANSRSRPIGDRTHEVARVLRRRAIAPGRPRTFKIRPVLSYSSD